jgi:hypothetical protein
MINSGDVLCALSLSKGSGCKITCMCPEVLRALSLPKGTLRQAPS